jgi:predicted RNA binding protein YcfA (HicA-like mRNA interferase family)
VKQRDLLKKIAKAAKHKKVDWYLAREGGNHSIYRLGSSTVPVPRHTEIGENTVAEILKECEKELGERWWLR